MGSSEKVPLIQREDPSVQIVLEKLSRFQQIKSIHLDRIDRVLFGEKFQANKPISILVLANVFS
jgi:hypothetical protein